MYAMLGLYRKKIGLISLFKLEWDNTQICYLLFAICHHPVGVKWWGLKDFAFALPITDHRLPITAAVAAIAGAPPDAY